MEKKDFLEGEVLAFDKPKTWTSFGIVARVRWLLTQKVGQKVKVGHAGTLDPLATGVLLLCTGRATKRIEELQSHEKEYVATLKLGATTPSFDMEHAEDATFPTAHITRGMVEEVLAAFTGKIEQVPPSFSACKIKGERAFYLARNGQSVNLKPKTITISQIELLSFQPTRIQIRVVCSKGTYIRALARDIGAALNSGAYLTGLRRTRVGDYSVEQCLNLESFPKWLDNVEVAPIA